MRAPPPLPPPPGAASPRALLLGALCAVGLLIGPAAGGAQDIRVGAEASFESEVRDIQWFTSTKKTLLLQTRTGHVHRSEDHGETWTESTKELGEIAGTTIRVGRFLRTSAAYDTVLAQAITGTSAGFISTDAGATWSKLQVEAKLQSWIFHPKRPTWALLSYWSEGCRRDLPSQVGKPCTHDLYVTRDLGKTTALVASRVVQFTWGAALNHQEDRIYLTHFREKGGADQPRLTKWMKGIDFSSTDDFGASFKAIVENGNKFQISNGYILLVKVANEASQDIRLMVSSDGGQSFKETELPHRLRHRSYTLLDTSEGAILLHVNNRNDVGDVYISDPSGVKYSLSLNNNVRKRGLCAFEKVMNLKGIYIANIEDDGGEAATAAVAAAKAEAEPEEAEVFEGEAGGTQSEAMTFRWRRLGEAWSDADVERHLDGLEADDASEGEAVLARADDAARQRKRRAAKAASSLGRLGGLLEAATATATGAAGDALPPPPQRRLGTAAAQAPQKLQTVISFDMGAAWQRVVPPEKDSSGKAVTQTCSQGACRLHLHGFTELFEFAPVYSYKNAVGILMGSGNVGDYLTFDKSQTNTYLSRDGGMTWAEVRKGTFIYEYGNHGGLVVIADMAAKTNEAAYTFDEGRSWNLVKFTEKPMEVTNVLIEPDATATKFIVYGKRERAGILHLLDFSKLHQRSCTGEAEAGGQTSDYEKWSPSDARAGECILGHKEIYVRRKQLAQCFNEDKWEHSTFSKNCQCTKENYECDLGFSRPVGSLNCRAEPATIPACKKGKDKVTVMPYRRVPGDTCEGGFKPEEVTVTCPSQAASSPAASASPSFRYERHGPTTPGPQSAASAAAGGSSTHTRLVLGGLLIVAAAAVYMLRRDWVEGGILWIKGVAGLDPAARVAGKYRSPAPVTGAEMVGASTGAYAPPPLSL